ncbi:MAG: NUDIX domain-containing protein [Patescibacteria group bacterium]
MASGEIIDILNDGDEIVGTMTREEAEKDNHTTQNVLVFVFNSLGKVWVQLRPKTKSHYPGRWDISACGSVLSGEKPEQAAMRETFEETGLKLKLKYVTSFLNVFPGDNGEERRRLSHLYVSTSDEQPRTGEEAEEFKAWLPEDLSRDVQSNPEMYIPSFLIELDKALEGYKELVKHLQD